ncbi:MAG: hypothetical protein M3Q07_11285 [Pseudobdellovibrionaceae bacterium]|nr:hypothetical protein [Pseudobdellovibrionaceae bacterium]
MKFLSVTFTALSVLTSSHLKAEDKTITIPMVASYTTPKEENGVCTGGGTGSAHQMEAKLVFKNGSRLAKWQSTMHAPNGTKVLFEIEISSIDGMFQFELRANDETYANRLFHHALFAPSDSIVSNGFFMTAHSNPSGCPQGIGVRVNSINIR